MILSFRTDMPGQTVCHSVCIIWTRYSMVEPHSSNFRVITTIFFGCPNIYEIYGSLSTLKFPWDRSRSTMLSKKGDLLATKRLFWAGKVYRSIPTTLFLKKNYTMQTSMQTKTYCHASKLASYQIKRFENCCLYVRHVHVSIHLTTYVF